MRSTASRQQLGSDGVVGTVVDDFGYWDEHAVEFFALGTAVSRVRPDVSPVKPTMTMPLNGGSWPGVQRGAQPRARCR
ncbi:hypothetical protein [Streptacidiphilus sp. MAP12-20]|uniref:hypothetical protein n=1 Tax=Streptacidiphilus sp. MAP12-20 TaxID=3156299 RepID=UPI00351218E3